METKTNIKSFKRKFKRFRNISLLNFENINIKNFTILFIKIRKTVPTIKYKINFNILW